MLLKTFSEKVASRAGITEWIAIATMIAEMVEKCINKPSSLAGAIDSPSLREILSLRIRARREFGWKEGSKVADAILAEAKPFRNEYAAAGGTAFEETVLQEVAEL